MTQAGVLRGWWSKNARSPNALAEGDVLLDVIEEMLQSRGYEEV